MELEVVMTVLKFAGGFIALSFVVFWVGLVWWVSQDVVTRTNDKIILAISVALACIFGPIGVLLYLIVRPRQTIRETYREMLETEINRKLASLDMTYCPFCGANLEQDADRHEVHPKQLSMTDLEQLQAAKPGMTDEQWVEEFVATEPKLRRQLPKINLGKVAAGSKVVWLHTTAAARWTGGAVVKGGKFLLTPLPQEVGPEVEREAEPKTGGGRSEVEVEREVGGGRPEAEVGSEKEEVVKKKAVSAKKGAGTGGKKRVKR